MKNKIIISSVLFTTVVLLVFASIQVLGQERPLQNCSSIISKWYGKLCKMENSSQCFKADLNNDGLVDYKDLAICGAKGKKEKYETIEGCLKWRCPTIYGAEYPKDCSPMLCNEKFCISLVFENPNQHLRELLNEYYSDSFSECVKIKVKGTIVKEECPSSDPACVPFERFNVVDLKVKK